MKIRYQRFRVSASEEATEKEEFDFDPSTLKVEAVQVTSDAPEKAYFRGSQKMTINGEEIFPDDYESKLLLSNVGVPAKDRFVPLGEIDPGNKKLKIEYKDTDHSSAPFADYTVTYVFKTLVK